MQTTDYVQQLDQASKCIKEACDGMDLRELAPVAESLENGPMKDLFSALASTFDSRKPFLSPFAFSRVSDLLAQSWAIRENTVSFPFGENSFTVKTSHGLKDGFVNRGLEISWDTGYSDQAVIREQVTNGVAVRMAVLFLTIMGGKPVENAN